MGSWTRRSKREGKTERAKIKQNLHQVARKRHGNYLRWVGVGADIYDFWIRRIR